MIHCYKKLQHVHLCLTILECNQADTSEILDIIFKTQDYRKVIMNNIKYKYKTGYSLRKLEVFILKCYFSFNGTKLVAKLPSIFG